MATYQGEAFLAEQLASLARQTRRPDELIISDDCSRDRTVEIAKAFAQTAAFPVQVFVNRTNIGFAKNFAAAARHSTGDLIFLADQDDIWRDDKIALMADIAADSTASVFSHDISVFSTSPSDATHPSYYRYLQAQGFSPAVCLKGCTLAIKSDFIARWGWPPEGATVSHDFWVALLATGLRQRQYVDSVLVDYRLHDRNASGWIATRNDLVRQPPDASLQQAPSADLDVLIELVIKRDNLNWTGSFLHALRQRGDDLDGNLIAEFTLSLQKNLTWYRENTATRRSFLPFRRWRKKG